eukprot:GHVU01212224.1.p2 GENE.GHVU01212224.1~~GHVU01212224.1.p2  ORF type:complete len:106 (+),score=8.33 GHVU01212224.1:265-582(+)
MGERTGGGGGRWKWNGERGMKKGREWGEGVAHTRFINIPAQAETPLTVNIETDRERCPRTPPRIAADMEIDRFIHRDIRTYKHSYIERETRTSRERRTDRRIDAS